MRGFVLVAMLFLAGCADLDSFLTPRDDLNTMMSEGAQLLHASTSQQKAMLAAAQERFMSSPNPMNRLRLAMLLATLPAPLRDDARAKELLEPIADASAPGAGAFAALLSTQIAEHQRLVREVERLARERANLERDYQLNEKERDKREEALRQQLEALRAIERGILEREERLRKKPPPG